MKLKLRRLRRLIFVLLSTVAVLNGGGVAVADNTGQIIGDFLKIIISGAMIEAAKKSWQKVDPEVRSCLQTNYGLNLEQLIQNGIKANDSRVVPYIQACRQAIEGARQQRAVEEARRQAEVEEQRRAQEEARLAAEREAAEVAARKEQARQARIADLKARFPADWVQKILDGKVELGWTPGAVREALGEPSQMIRTPDGTEMWSYNGRRIIFTNGRVTYVGS